jgi:hypothetical protein
MATSKYCITEVDNFIEFKKCQYRDAGAGHVDLYRYQHISDSEITTYLKDDDFAISKVGSAQGDQVKPEIRSSKIYKSKNLTFHINYIYNNYDSHYSYAQYSSKNIYYSFIPPYLNVAFQDPKLLKYETGDHFNTFHYDTFKDNEIGTYLYYPPNGLFNTFTGGELIFQLEDGSEKIIEPAKFTKWTLITFGNILHKCQPVTSGVRYVFKGLLTTMLANIYHLQNAFNLSQVVDTITNYQKSDEKKQKVKDNVIENKAKVTTIAKKMMELECQIKKMQMKMLDTNLLEIMDTEEVNDDTEVSNYYLIGKDDDSMPKPDDIIISEDIHSLVKNLHCKQIYSNLNSEQKEQMDTYSSLIQELKELKNQFITARQEYRRANIKIQMMEELQAKGRECKFQLPTSSNLIIYNIGSCYDNPENLDNYNLHELNIIKHLLENKCKVIPVNLRFQHVEFFDKRYNDKPGLSIETNYGYQDIYLNDVSLGKLQTHYSEYNDESGYDQFNIYLNTCFIAMR